MSILYFFFFQKWLIIGLNLALGFTAWQYYQVEGQMIVSQTYIKTLIVLDSFFQIFFFELVHFIKLNLIPTV